MLSGQLSRQAGHDSLTNLVNRVEFEKRLMRTLNHAKQEGTEHCLCYMDLDQFVIINDTYGHTAGNELLRQLGGYYLKRSVRVILLPDWVAMNLVY